MGAPFCLNLPLSLYTSRHRYIGIYMKIKSNQIKSNSYINPQKYSSHPSLPPLLAPYLHTTPYHKSKSHLSANTLPICQAYQPTTVTIALRSPPFHPCITRRASNPSNFGLYSCRTKLKQARSFRPPIFSATIRSCNGLSICSDMVRYQDYGLGRLCWVVMVVVDVVCWIKVVV
jgi:hypothetical protein